jgi:hypothetical protein
MLRRGEAVSRAIWGLLALSVGLNLLLLVRGSGDEQSRETPGPDDRPSQLAATDFDEHSSRQERAESLRVCEQRVAQLEAQVKDIQEKNRSPRRIDETFATKAPNSKLQGKLQTELERIAEKLDGGAEAWTVECRENVCKIVFVSAERAAFQMQSAIQRDSELRQQFSTTMVGGGEPTTEMPSKRILFQSTAYMEERPASDVDRQKTWMSLNERLNSLRFGDCLLNAPDAGASMAFIRLQEGQAPTITIAGGLAFTFAEECIRTRILGELQKFGPGDFSMGPAHFWLTLIAPTPGRGNARP